MSLNRKLSAGLLLIILCVPILNATQAVAQNFWDGSNGNLWSDPENWSLGAPPSGTGGSQRPVFAAPGAMNLTTIIYDMPSGGAHSYTFNTDSGTGITISGFDNTSHAVSFTGSGLTAHGIDGLRFDVLAGEHVIQGAMVGGSTFDIGFSASGGTNEAPRHHGFYVEANAKLTFNATLGRSVAGQNLLVKYGDGTMVVNAPTGINQTRYRIDDGILQLGVNGARGNSATPYTVTSGATLQLNNMSYNSNNGTLTLNGAGHGNLGALHAIGGASTIPSGTTAAAAVNPGSFLLETDTVIGVDAGSVLTVTDDITDPLNPISNPGGTTSGLTKIGEGTLVLASASGYHGETVVAGGTLLINTSRGGVKNVASSAFDGTVTTIVLDGTESGTTTGLSIGQTLNGASPTSIISAMNSTTTLIAVGDVTGQVGGGGSGTATFEPIENGLYYFNDGQSAKLATVQSGATLGGSGMIRNTHVDIETGGTLAPGAGIGVFDVASADIDGTLQIEFEGSTIDRLNVLGELDISSATLDLTSLGSLMGSVHVLAEYGSLVGTAFASITGMPQGFDIDYNYQQNQQIALISLLAQPGDFDSDGDVDGGDFAKWQSNFPISSGAVLLDGDADGDGDVDGADFVVWQTNFNAGQPVSSVPEPAGIFMLAAAAVFVSVAAPRCRKRRAR
jgi:autotransporter-associated beta strand protein